MGRCISHRPALWVRWSRDLSFSVEFPPLPRTPGSAILLAEGSTLASYEASSGTRRWQTQYPSEGATDFRVSYPTDNIFILADGTGNITQNQLVGIDRQTGEIQWRNTIDLPGEQIRVTLPLFTSGSTGLQPVLFITAQGHRILRLNPSTGDVTDQYTAQIADQFSSAGTCRRLHPPKEKKTL
jgi:outer membrane protein assembly factor BamB